MAPVLHLHGTVRRVGNSLALVIPADEARRAGIKAGDAIDADLRPKPQPTLGLLKGRLAYRPFERRDGDRDRV